MSISQLEDRLGLWASLTTYFGYALLMAFGYLRDLAAAWLPFVSRASTNSAPNGYAPLASDFEDFYKRRLYYRIRDAFNRPISSCPGDTIDVMDRISRDYNRTYEYTGSSTKCINLGSYNYLGFADPDSPCQLPVLKCLEEFSVSTCSSRTDFGTTRTHVELERLVARFVGKPAALVFSMGFATNSTGIPSLIGEGGLIISDNLNHASIVIGARSSGATIRVFEHNNLAALDETIRRAIIDGQPKSHRPWRKIIIVVEGIYSMEGEICPLEAIVAIKKKYGVYLFVDEAHSIGALGESGRGICEYRGVDPTDIDILMGTFTKSFGAVGGYLASSVSVIKYLRRACAGSAYSPSISIPCCQQVISAMKIIAGEDGTTLGRDRLLSIRRNANFFRQGLIDMGCLVLGDWDSPVIPVMLCNPAKISAFSREALARGLAVVVVGFPATPLLHARVRFCISAGHTKEQLEDALTKIDEISGVTHIKYVTKLIG